MSVAVIVVNFGSAKLLAKNLDGERRPHGPEIVVVDNFTSEAEREELRRLAAKRRWHLVELDANQGFGAATNAGVERAKELTCDVFVLLNPDAWILVEDFRNLIHAHSLNPHAIIAPRILKPDGTEWFSGGEFSPHSGVARHQLSLSLEPSNWLTAACLLIPRDAWETLEGFDEDYFLYWEDVDLTHRWASLGGALEVALEATAWHSVGGTQSSDHSKSNAYFFYNCRNRLRFATKNLRMKEALIWLITSPMYVLEVARRGGLRRARFKAPAALLSALAGTASGSVFLISGIATRTFTRDRQGRRQLE